MACLFQVILVLHMLRICPLNGGRASFWTSPTDCKDRSVGTHVFLSEGVDLFQGQWGLWNILEQGSNIILCLRKLPLETNLERE